MLTKRYLISTKNLPAIMQKIVDGTAPPKFNIEHLRGIGFAGSQDRAFVPVLKGLGFLAEDGTPLQRYHDYRDKSQSKRVLGEALKEAYSDIFHINATPIDADRDAIHGKFKSAHNVSDAVADKQTVTFLSLLKLADLGGPPVKKKVDTPIEDVPPGTRESHGKMPIRLRYNIEVHLPATKDIDVYNAIFKSLKTHLLT